MSEPTASAVPPFHDPELVAAVAAWMPGTRWYPMKGVEATWVLERAYDLGDDAAILLLRCDETLLQVPVAWRDEQGQAPIAQLAGRWLVDGVHDERAVAAIVEATTGARAAEGLEGSLLGEAPAAGGAMRVIEGEQSNTSVVGGDGAWIAKLFRVVAPGDNPDVVVTSALTGAGCARVPSLVGSLRATWSAGPEAFVTGHLVAVSRFVEGAEDAWELFLAHASATARGEAELELPDARALGEAVAQVHADLADALGTAEADEADLLRFVTGLEQRLAWAREEASEVLEELSDELAAAADRLREIEALGSLQHIHGDLHLGQVLRAGDGSWVLLDFEGEPLRPLHERMVREPRLRDVVGMLRSFDYAGGTALRERADGDSDATGAWVVERQREFLAGYGSVAGEVDEHDPVFRALLLDKALYEVVYELRNRPSWVPVPLEAVRRLVT